MRSSIG